ncbi:RND transporter [Paenibacillus darwinianus]|uniref:RND transporter n=1 Tax=Paenibacillus darwinianus TaxID=1380763 RepID=A0A9W5RZD4_9BACL|nr:efflux RND transporter periplasmic adaptor subunit [Paenibacillus darwinianus]EXX84612.1 RND transporter [Paenibacillus darwinianus]EXX84645.1 RND transporter [Paenibacillus darwinianus]
MPNNRTTRYRRWVYKAAAAVAVSLLAGCSMLPQEEAALAPPLVKPQTETFDVVEAARGDIQTYLKGTAIFASSQTVSLYFKESGGRIKTVLVQVGDDVKAGQAIVELDVGDLELRTRLQRLNVERAEILYAQAKSDGLSGSELRLRQIDLERERITLVALEDQLSKSKLVSPQSGRVTYLAELKAGDAVTGYQPIVTVADPTKVKLTYQATSAKDLLAVQPNMAAFVTYGNQQYEAQVLQAPSNAPMVADKELAEKNATTLVLGLVKPIKGAVMGDSADFQIALEKRDDVIVLPRSGIRTYLGREYVQIAEGERRIEVDVEVGLKTPTEVEIVRGLEEGQQVIMNN